MSLDRSIFNRTHFTFEIVHEEEPDVVKPLNAALEPLGWEVVSMEVTRPGSGDPVPGREALVEHLDEVVYDLTRTRRRIADGEALDLFNPEALEDAAREFERLLSDRIEVEVAAEAAALTSGHIKNSEETR